MIKTIQNSKYYSKKRLTLAIKLAIVILILYILYLQLFVQHDLNELSIQFNNSIQRGNNWIALICALVLMPLNWFLEGRKWKILVEQFQQFTIKDALKSVFSGISVAILTPGRIGEYGGRLVGIEKENQPKAIVANLISSLSQNIITITFGLMGALLFISSYISIEPGVYLSLTCLSMGIISAMVLIYFRIDLLSGLLAYMPNWKLVEKIRSSVSSFSKIETKTLFTLLRISGIRYLVFGSQYVFLLIFFGVTNDILAASLGVATIFFLQSNLPLPPALSVLARGEMAIFMWSVFSTNVLGILAASFSLWLINLMIPALIGTSIITRAKLFNS